MNHSESTIRRRTSNIGYRVEKGLQHFGQFVYHDSCDDRFTGYMVKDLYTGFYEWGCYSEDFDHRHGVRGDLVYAPPSRSLPAQGRE